MVAGLGIENGATLAEELKSCVIIPGSVIQVEA
jgi:hypothetical protein